MELLVVGWILLAFSSLSEKIFKNKDTAILVSFVSAIVAFTLFTYGLFTLVF